MSQKTVVTVVCDLPKGRGSNIKLCGVEGAETITFSFEGKDYEIDLCAKHAAAFRKLWKPYITHARRIGSRRRPAHRTAASRPVSPRSADKPAGHRPGRPALPTAVPAPRKLTTKAERDEVRAWGLEHGIGAPRGRVSASTIVKYDMAHSDDTRATA